MTITTNTTCNWKPDRPVKVSIITAAKTFMYGTSFETRNDALNHIASMIGDESWLPVIDGMVRTSEILGIEVFGESDREHTPIRAFFDTDDGRHHCAIGFESFDEAESEVSMWIANRGWLMCEDMILRSSSVRAYGFYDMRGPQRS